MKDNIISKIIKYIGIGIIVLGSISFLIAGIGAKNIVMVISGIAGSFISGMIFLGFSEIIKLLQQNVDKQKEPLDEEKLDIDVKSKEKENKTRNEILKAPKIKEKIKVYSFIALLCLIVLIIAMIIGSSVNHKNAISAIETYIENEQYEHAFDEINKGKLSFDEKNNYLEEIKPEMIAQFEAQKEQFQVLDIDGFPIYKRDNVIYYYDDNNKEVELYKSREADGTFRDIGDGAQYWVEGERVYIGSDFIYANGYIIFIEFDEEKTGKKIDSYKSVKAVNLETGHYDTLEYNSNSTELKKLTNGKILVNSFPDVIFNPYTGEVEEKYKLLTDEERDNFIYSTD